MRELSISKSFTNRDYRSLDKYLAEINGYPLLPSGRETELAIKIRAGDQAALNEMVNANLRFVVSVAKQYQHQGVALGDLINEGNLGLITAAKRYDETKGFKFISYAVWWIRQAIIFAIAEQSRIVHLPYNQVTMLGKLYKAIGHLEQQYGRQPSIEELAEALQISGEKVNDLLRFDRRKISFDQPVNEDGNSTLLDVLSHDDPAVDLFIVEESIHEDLRLSLAFLSPRERLLIGSYFGINSIQPMSLEEIACQASLSVEHVRRLKDGALLRLRNSQHARMLRSYLT